MAASSLNKCVFFKTVQIKAGTKIAIGYTVPMANWRTLVTGCLSGALLSAQAADKVDFKRDIRPIFEQNCYGCHGPTQQMGGMRLDRRSSAMLNRGGTVIGAGNTEGSRLYLKLIGSKAGQRMPPTGPLSVEQIDVIKRWIDQGAEWPDDVSGEESPFPGDPAAQRLIDALCAGDREKFARLVKEHPEAVKLKGKDGSTPLMYAAVYGDLDSMRMLIERGADVNAANQAGATALMWAADDAEKTRLLLEHGADPNGASATGRTAIRIALGYQRSAVVKLLLDHGAKTDPGAYRANPFPLAASNEELLRTVLDHGVPPERLGAGIAVAVEDGCQACVQILAKAGNKIAFSPGAAQAASFRDPKLVMKLLELGANPNYEVSDMRFTPLMYAVVSETAALPMTKALIERGADLNVKSAEGATALDFALRQGDPAVVELLRKAGAVEGDASPKPELKMKPATSALAAVERSLPLLQRNDVTFISKTGCVSCHNDNLTALAVAGARRQGLKVDEEIARSQKEKIAAFVESRRENYLQGVSIAGGPDTTGYILLGLAAENWPADPATDAMARYLKNEQRADGSWPNFASRPPIESSDIQTTAVALRSLQVYGLKTARVEYDRAARRAADWLAAQQPVTSEDRDFQILGLVWASRRAPAQTLARDLLSAQRADGGWSQTASLASDAYATGQALFALQEAEALRPADAAYQRGARFLMNTQCEDGSWYVRSRSIPFQPQFQSGFPYGRDQFISAAATNWAAIALTPLAQ